MSEFSRQQGIPDELPDDLDSLRLTGEYIPRLSDIIGNQVMDMSGQMSSENVMCGGGSIEGAVVFVDLGSFTSRSRDLSKPQLAFWINRFYRHLPGVAKEHRATFDKTIGDCVMYVFSEKLGCKTPALSAIQFSLQSISWDLWDYRPHVGVASGGFWLGPFGPPNAFTMSVVGDPVNLAARLAGKAGARAAAISQTTWQAAGSTLQLDDRFTAERKVGDVKDFPTTEYLVVQNKAFWSIPQKFM